jgi:COP9 signalosome complex subunit 5
LISRLWNEYWIATLSSSPLLSNQLEITKQVQDINQKIGKAGKQAALSLGSDT